MGVVHRWNVFDAMTYSGTWNLNLTGDKALGGMSVCNTRGLAPAFGWSFDQIYLKLKCDAAGLTSVAVSFVADLGSERGVSGPYQSRPRDQVKGLYGKTK